jgi:dihydrofolate reductase
MGKIVVSEFVSVDGVMEGPGGDGFERGGWTFDFDFGADGGKFKMVELFDADAMLLGRRTYDGFAAAWPERTDEPDEFTDRMNGIKKYVVSSTLTDPAWRNSEVIGIGDVARLREETAGSLLVAGSAQLVQALADQDLVDTYRLMVFPVVIGAGRKLFGDTGATQRLQVVQSHPVGKDGVSVTVLDRVR